VDVNGTRNLLQACVRTASAHHRVVQRRGLWLPRRQPRMAHRVRPGARQRALPIPATSGWSRKCWPTTGKSIRELEQVIFRIGTILGPTVRNQITDLFEKPRLAIAGSDSPFVFIHDQDVVGAILLASPAFTT
jgi:UDP-glucose 4-epimerase